MNLKRLAIKLLPLSAAMFCLPGLALAGGWQLGGVPSTGPVGGGVSAPAIQVLFSGDGTTTDAQTSISIPAGFSASATAQNTGGCLVGAGFVNVTSSTGAIIPAGPTNFCTITFTVLAATAAGNYNIVAPAVGGLTNECFDGGGNNFSPCTSPTNGTGALVVSAGPQPALSSVPAPASTITITDVIGGGATTGSLVITNSGQVGSTLNIAAATGLSGVLSIAPATAQTAAQGSAGVAYTISCAAVAAGTTSQTLSFVHNGTAPASPVTYTVECIGAVGPTAPTASLGAVVQPGAGPINTVSNGTVPVNVDSAGVAVASLGLNCTIPTTGASNFLVTAGGTRTITAPATVGANAPAVGVSCVLGAAPVNATLSCAQTATPGPSPAALTAVVTCPAGVVAPSYGSSPAPGGTIAAIGIEGTTAAASLSITNTLGTAPLNVTNCTASAGFTITSPAAFPVAVAPGGSTAIALSCVAPAAGTSVPGTLTCAHNATNVASPATYVLACNGVTAVVPTMSDLGKILLASLVIGLGLLGMGLRRQA